MGKTAKRIGSLLIACMLIAAALFGPVAVAEGLLEAMIEVALREGRTIEGTLRVEAGNLLSAFSLDPESAAGFAAVDDLLKNGLLRVRYTQDAEAYIIGAALEVQGETMLTLEARAQGDEIAVITSLLPGKTLVVPSSLFEQAIMAQMPDVTGDALMGMLAGAAERYGMVAIAWAAQSEGVYSTGGPIAATGTRDAAAQTATLRVTDAQWQALLVSLAESFEQDVALQQALAAQMEGVSAEDLAALAMMMAGAPAASQGGAAEVTLYLDEADQIVGIDVVVEPPASVPAGTQQPFQGSFSYGRRSNDAGQSTESYRGSFGWGDDSELGMDFYRQDKVPSQILPAEGEEYGGRARLYTPDTGALDLEVIGDIRVSVEPVAETYDHTFDFRVSQAAGGTGAADLSALLQSPLLSGGFALHSQTDVVELYDFLSQGHFTLMLMGMEAAVQYTLGSSSYAPTAHPESAVIRLDTLTDGEMDALAREMEENAQRLMMSLLSRPAKQPALNVYAVDDETVPSIDSVVGFREITNSEAGITEGKPYVMVFYQTADVMGDLQAYIDQLVDSGWVMTGLEGEMSGGTAQMAAESAHDGALLLVTIEFTADAYSVLTHRTSGTLRRYADDAGNQLGEITYTK